MHNNFKHSVYYFQNFWIGLNKLDFPGNWVWEFRGKDPLSFENWLPGQPNNLGVEKCVQMHGYVYAGFWNNVKCSVYKSYICEKEGINRSVQDALWFGFVMLYSSCQILMML